MGHTKGTLPNYLLIYFDIFALSIHVMDEKYIRSHQLNFIHCRLDFIFYISGVNVYVLTNERCFFDVRELDRNIFIRRKKRNNGK